MGNVLTLYQLNSLVRELLEGSFTDSYWVTAELSEVRESVKGHCFLELVEQGERGGAPRAKARAVIYSSLWPMLRLTFEDATGQTFRAGIKVQLQVDIAFSEAYGYSLIVRDIDPTYTLGSLALLRKQILEQLQSDGVIAMNKALSLPRPLQRIAVISSATAAGYGDFCKQLDGNPQGFAFRHRLFPAVMQGESTARSVIGALDAVAVEAELWDVVVIIRGGGAVSDLAGFEDYELAACCAQFPLPVITGIGHERDTTVLDFVANTSLKTPTAVAAFFIERMEDEARLLQQFERIGQQALRFLDNRRGQLQQAEQALATALRHYLQTQRRNLELFERAVAYYNPVNILKLGYSITRHNGKAVTGTSSLAPGDTLVTQFAEGTTESTVKQVYNG
ncbi:MAG: exodeoxyribonuclease VII large subunit [Bacteroidaceae bacterium]|nr:exodeoxyribonuclease VII large subunit [Bacteroidaceae bacterium]